MEAARGDFERKADRLGRAWLADRRLDRCHLGRRLKRRLPTLCAVTKQDVLCPFPEDVDPGEAGLRQRLKRLGRRRE